MRYFTYLAEQSFITNEQGQRLFCIDGPLSRPYLIDDPAMETRLFWKLTWHYRIFLGTLLIVQPFLIPFLLPHPWAFFGLLAGAVGIQWITLRVLFGADLRSLPRQEKRSSLRSFYRSFAGRHSEGVLWLGFWTCVVFVVILSISFWVGFTHFTISITGLLFLTLAAAAWGYALKLKKHARPEGTSLIRVPAAVVGPGRYQKWDVSPRKNLPEH